MPARKRREDGPQPAAGDAVAAAKAICLRLLTVRSRSRFELATKLEARGIPTEAADQALDRLTEVGLIDDAAFAEAFVRTLQRDRGLGRRALRLELDRKGIDRAVIDGALSTVGDDDERSRAAELVARKLDAAMLAAGPRGAQRRLMAMLARRGYPPSIAIGVVNEALHGYATEMIDSDDE